MNWTTIKNHKNEIVGHIRRLSATFAPEEWEIRGLPGVVFEDSLDAMKFVLETTQGMQWVVKTELSHRYFAGETWTDNPSEARRFAREDMAQRVADAYSNRRGWDRVCVATWHPTNWS